MEHRQTYKELLANVSAVTRNESSDSVNGILDTVSVSEDLRMVSREAHSANANANEHTLSVDHPLGYASFALIVAVRRRNRKMNGLMLARR